MKTSAISGATYCPLQKWRVPRAEVVAISCGGITAYDADEHLDISGVAGDEGASHYVRKTPVKSSKRRLAVLADGIAGGAAKCAALRPLAAIMREKLRALMGGLVNIKV